MRSGPYGIFDQHAKPSLTISLYGLKSTIVWLSLGTIIKWLDIGKYLSCLIKLGHKLFLVRFRIWLMTLGFKWKTNSSLMGESCVSVKRFSTLMALSHFRTSHYVICSSILNRYGQPYITSALNPWASGWNAMVLKKLWFLVCEW